MCEIDGSKRLREEKTVSEGHFFSLEPVVGVSSCEKFKVTV